MSFDPTALRAEIAGDVVVPGDSAWDTSRAAWNLSVDQNPAAVVLAENAGDVAAALTFAHANDLRVAPQGPGHGAASLAGLDDVLLLRTTRMTGVEIDPGAQTARVRAGAIWHDVVPPAAEHGLAALHGSTGTVGVAGYTTGGGIGWLARRHGYAANHVTSLEVVTADGEERTVTADADPDLFWALRGGGGSHAVVTALTFGLIELREAYAGQLMFPMEQARDIVSAYAEWAAQAPEHVSSALKLMRFPPIPDIPEPLRGRELVSIGVAAFADEAAARELVAPLRDVTEPYLDTLATMDATGLPMVAGDPPNPVPGRGDSLLIGELGADTVDAYLELNGPGAQTPLLFLELRQLGGALTRSAPEHGAADFTNAAFQVYGVGMAMNADMVGAIGAKMREVKERLAPWSTGETLLNFAEGQPGTRDSFPAEKADRLAQVKAEYDPDRVIVGNHRID